MPLDRRANKHPAAEVPGTQGRPESVGEGLKEESYEPIVPLKVGNWENRDPLEGRGEQTDVAGKGTMAILRDRRNMSTKFARIAELAREDRGRKFSSIRHLDVCVRMPVLE